MMSPTGGAIGVISATERALSSQNSNLNRYLYDQLFRRNTLVAGADTLVGAGQLPRAALGSAARGQDPAPGTGPINNTKYQLMGDPATRAQPAAAVDGVTLTDAAGSPVTQLQRGQTVTFHGLVLDRPGGAPPVARRRRERAGRGLGADRQHAGRSLQRRLRIRMEPELRLSRRARSITATSRSRRARSRGASWCRWTRRSAPRGRIRAYLAGPIAALATDGVGRVHGPGRRRHREQHRHAGPAHHAVLRRRCASPCGRTRRCKIDLFDESGIMTTGHTPQNSIIVTLDDNTTSRVDVTPSFRYAADSYQAGTASFLLPNLSPGHHQVQVSAADNLATGITASQHRSQRHDRVRRRQRAVAGASRARSCSRTRSARPGPGAGGVFVVDAPGDSLNTMIRIFTVSGRVGARAQALRRPGPGPGPVGRPGRRGRSARQRHLPVQGVRQRPRGRWQAAARGRRPRPTGDS